MDKELKLRRATINDARLIFDLANEKVVRACSIQTEPILWDDHLQWFRNRLSHEHAPFYMAFDRQEQFIGTLRYEPSERGWIISIQVTPTHRGQGWGQRLLNAGKNDSDLCPQLAYVKKDNIASQRLFLSCDFTLIGEEEIKNEFYYLYSYRPRRMKSSVYIIAEISANHCGDLQLAKKMIKAAHAAGADAVKIQTYTADTLTLNVKDERFRVSGGTLWDGQYLHDLYQEAYTPWEWQAELKVYADEIGIDFFSTPFDHTAVDFLESVGVEIYKIASFEAIDIPLIEYTASKGKPMIISTGICSEAEIKDIIDACHRVGNTDITLLKCTSAYPAKPEDMNLLTMVDMKKFGTKVGLSDHSMNVETVITAVALGAQVIEKHFTLDRALGGPDAAFSLNEQELREMVQAVRLTEQLLGKVDYRVNEKNRRFARSLFVAEDVAEGEIFTEKNIRSVRPSDGCAPKLLPQILGQRASCALTKGTPMSLEYLAGE